MVFERLSARFLSERIERALTVVEDIMSELSCWAVNGGHTWLARIQTH